MGKWLCGLVAAIIFANLLIPSRDSTPPAGNPHRVSTPSEPRKPTELTRSPSGHFYAHAQVNGQLVRFIVDTGASIVALTPEDAERVGIKFDPSRAELVGEGAGGAVYGQNVKIDSIEIDGKLVNDVRGVVLRDSNLSLLGQSYLTRMGSVQMSGDYMVLR